ncbi:hypothetical protein GGU10DRAFT_348639 [Lentinula aff. detonsa]|uniref:Protein kinase domain-containing protein n=1 Tax=Lentinula aff. detonsa TaxID=2804958 RepID=A0AA38KTR7_9AGAR|nr:hypothetical protein GGU10DRAFT_348639 [Lentinula aff. detonsa]
MLFGNTLQLLVGFLFVTSIHANSDTERIAKFNQNMNRPWIIKDAIGNPVCPGSRQNEIVYKKNLTKKLGDIKLLSNVGKNSEGVYTFPPGVDYEINGKKVPGDSLVVKLLRMDSDYDSCEAEILRRIGSLRDHGKLWKEADFGSDVEGSPGSSPSGARSNSGSDSGHSDSGSDSSVEWLDYGVLVMNKAKGKSLSQYEWWKQLSGPQKKELVEKTLVDIKNKVYDLVKSKRLLYADLNLDNILVETKTDVHGIHSFKEAHLVDFGFPGIFTVRQIPEPEEFDSWFYEQFNFYSADLRKAQNWREFNSGRQLAESDSDSSSGAGKRLSNSNHDAGTGGGTGQVKKQRQRRRRLRMIEDS